LGKPRVNFIACATLMVVGLGLNYAGLYYFGGMGAAYALIAYNVISLITMIAILKKYMHLEVRNIPVYMFQCYRDIYALVMNKVVRRKKNSAAQ